MIENEDEIASWFADHDTPEGSVVVRAHYLEKDSAQLKEFMSRARYLSNKLSADFMRRL